MDFLVKDLRFALRMLLKNPGFTAIAVLTLALGIGANAAIFSVVNAVLLRPLPYPDPDHLVPVWRTTLHDDTNLVSAPNYFDWRRQTRVFEDMAQFDSAGSGYNLSEGNEPERISGVRVVWSAQSRDVLQLMVRGSMVWATGACGCGNCRCGGSDAVPVRSALCRPADRSLGLRRSLSLARWLCPPGELHPGSTGPPGRSDRRLAL
ncbi:MAG: hypothetical protein LAO31_09865 [Acidobacteriia bacterium]|nr:hypothetical protein [Terriglobia bacterium]